MILRIAQFVKIWVSLYFQRDFIKPKREVESKAPKTTKYFARLLQIVKLIEDKNFKTDANDLKLCIIKVNGMNCVPKD